MSVERRHLIERIQALSDEDFEQVKPHIEAEIDALEDPAGIDIADEDVDVDELMAEIERGRESARKGPLLTTDEVMRRVDAELAARRRT